MLGTMLASCRGDRPDVPASTTLRTAALLFPALGALLLRASVAQDAGDVPAMLAALRAIQDALAAFLLAS
jgi:hypothetical protein